MSESNLDCIRPYDVSLPVVISENQFLIGLGVEFGPFQSGDKWRQSRIPLGWSIKRDGKSDNHIYLVDSNNSFRSFIYTNKNSSKVKIMFRFHFGIDESILDRTTKVRLCVWDKFGAGDKLGKVVFEVSYSLPNLRVNKNAHQRLLESFNNKDECGKWLNDNYPDWNDSSAYWEVL